MSVTTHIYVREAAATDAASLAVKTATETWRIVSDGGAGDNDTVTVAWAAVKEAESVWKTAMWEECNVLQGACGLMNIENGLPLSAYERALPRYMEAYRQMVRLVELLRARGYKGETIHICVNRISTIEKDIALMCSFMEKHREEAAANRELTALREKAVASGDLLLGWDERIAVAGRAAVARESIISSPLYYKADEE